MNCEKKIWLLINKIIKIKKLIYVYEMRVMIVVDFVIIVFSRISRREFVNVIVVN